MAFFHSISAFCNAGFDLFGTAEERFLSLTSLAGDPTVNIVIMLLIIIGGIGFLTWDDIRQNKFHFRRYRMQSKVILLTSGLLILLPFVYNFFFEFGDYPIGKRILVSLFQSVTTRTAGFNTVDLAKMTPTGKLIMIILMLVGGSPGSTAGGMKTTTFAVLFALSLSVFRRREDPHAFGRRIDPGAVKNAAAILVFYLTLLFAVRALSALSNLSRWKPVFLKRHPPSARSDFLSV